MRGDRRVRVMFSPVACPSGQRSTPRKRVWGQLHRGFESHRHRHGGLASCPSVDGSTEPRRIDQSLRSIRRFLVDSPSLPGCLDQCFPRNRQRPEVPRVPRPSVRGRPARRGADVAARPLPRGCPCWRCRRHRQARRCRSCICLRVRSAARSPAASRWRRRCSRRMRPRTAVVPPTPRWSGRCRLLRLGGHAVAGLGRDATAGGPRVRS